MRRRCVMYHFQVNRSKSKVTRVFQIFVVGAGYPNIMKRIRKLLLMSSFVLIIYQKYSTPHHKLISSSYMVVHAIKCTLHYPIQNSFRTNHCPFEEILLKSDVPLCMVMMSDVGFHPSSSIYLKCLTWGLMKCGFPENTIMQYIES